MHDDETPITPEPELPEEHWTEAQWEHFMLENEKLMDRYERVWKENPDRTWDDPLDLYYKVHYDLDAPEQGKEEEAERHDVSAESSEPKEGSTSTPEPGDVEIDDFR